MIGILTALLLEAGLSLPAFAQEVHHFDIDTTDAAVAIHQFGSQSGVQILASAEALNGKQLNKISGELSSDDGFRKLLAGTGLSYRYVGERAVALVSETPVPDSDSSRTPLAPQALNSIEDSDRGTAKKSDKTGWLDRFRLAQADTSVAEEKNDRQTESRRLSTGDDTVGLGEIVVTGTRLKGLTKSGPLPVNIYTRDDIERSGQSTVAGFLSTLPEASISFSEARLQSPGQAGGLAGSTTVQLRGLPVGTTAVLLNGRPLHTTGGNTNVFDLNLIPLAAIERIEVVPQGSSAVYGSDALAGVVNFILKRQLSGISLETGYGSASGTNEILGSAAWGKTWTRGHLSIVGNYFTRSALQGSERAITADNDYTPFGGPDRRSVRCNPGNVYSTDGSNLPGLSSAQAGIPDGLTGTPSISDFTATAGQLNRCSARAFADHIPATDRVGALMEGSYQFGPSLEWFTELLYSNIQQLRKCCRPSVFSFFGGTMSASNPLNPFGVDVLIDYQFKEPETLVSNEQDSDFTQVVMGLRGDVGRSWDWELVASESKDKGTIYGANEITDFVNVPAALASSDPATAFNPFTSERPASPDVMAGFFDPRTVTVSGHVRVASVLARGPLFSLPAGKLQSAFGAEYRDYFYQQKSDFFLEGPGLDGSFNSYGVYGEIRAPLIAAAGRSGGADTLALTAAVRYDDFSSFGGKVTPQAAFEWRPAQSWLVRAAYSEAYKAPPIAFLNSSVFTNTFGFTPIVDPLRGGEVTFPILISGGNPDLLPATGNSRSVGVAWDSDVFDGLKMALSWWSVMQEQSITTLFPQSIVDNESFYPGRVVRGPAVGGQPGPIETVDFRFVNFGRYDVSGIDLGLDLTFSTVLGTFEPNLSVTNTQKYDANVTPDAPTADRLNRASTDGWAPRWKGTVGLNWSYSVFNAGLAGRYVGSYLDYGSSTREIGDFWLFDLHARVALGRAFAANRSIWAGSYVSFGAVNLFDSLPQYSDFDGSGGYDPAQANLRGRFLYLNIGSRW